MEYKINCIGVFTSGGDAPGMNAALRAVTRAAISNGIKVKAIYRGYKGLIDDEIKEFTTQDVSGIVQRGGTIIKTARCMEFKTPEGRKQVDLRPCPACLRQRRYARRGGTLGPRRTALRRGTGDACKHARGH